MVHNFNNALEILTFLYVKVNTWGKPSIQSLIKTREEHVVKFVAKCFIWGDAPVYIAKNNS